MCYVTILGRHIQVHGRICRAEDQGLLFGARATHNLGSGRQGRNMAEKLGPAMNYTGQIRDRLPKDAW